MQMAIELEETSIFFVGPRFDVKRRGRLGSSTHRAGGKRSQNQSKKCYGQVRFAGGVPAGYGRETGRLSKDCGR
jgi:hypothetical protein